MFYRLRIELKVYVIKSILNSHSKFIYIIYSNECFMDYFALTPTPQHHSIRSAKLTLFQMVFVQCITLIATPVFCCLQDKQMNQLLNVRTAESGAKR